MVSLMQSFRTYKINTMMLACVFNATIKPIQWLTLQKCVTDPTTYAKQLYRDNRVAQAYKDYQQAKDFSKLNKLLQSKQTVLVLNDFPYYVDNHIDHYVLWLASANSSQSLIEYYIRTQAHAKNIKYKEFLFFRNPIYLQSVPQIPHYQV